MLSESGLTIGLIDTGPIAEGPVVTLVKLIICWFKLLNKKERRTIVSLSPDMTV
jgi:hypothetical protein